jgi:hypothetical protein
MTKAQQTKAVAYAALSIAIVAFILALGTAVKVHHLSQLGSIDVIRGIDRERVPVTTQATHDERSPLQIILDNMRAIAPPEDCK